MPEPDTDLTEIWELLRSIPDPEIPAINIVELGVVRRVYRRGETLCVQMTPTYSGCPALQVMKDDVQALLTRKGYQNIELDIALSPAWTTDWLTEETKEKLRQTGIAPPEGNSSLVQIGKEPKVPCPHCKSRNTTEQSSFGPTACKALYRCNACREPFEYFKVL